jgi:hypothetical protein
MVTRFRTRSHNSVSLGFVAYIAIGLIIAISQDYWNLTDWDGHELRSLLTAFLATVFWPISIFYTVGLTPR